MRIPIRTPCQRDELRLRGIAGFLGCLCMFRQRDRFKPVPERLVFFHEIDNAPLQHGDILLFKQQDVAVTMPVSTMTARQSANPVECFMRLPPVPVVM